MTCLRCSFDSIIHGRYHYLFGQFQTVHRNMSGFKIYERRGGAKPSIYFTNPTYFYVRSWTDQISVLFCRGPLFVYAVLRKTRKFIRTADKLTTSMLARKCHVASCATSHYGVIDAGMKVKAYFEILWVREDKSNITWL